jgi:hypothetical protein
MRCGSKPSDGGFLILSDEDRDDLPKKEPDAGRFLGRYNGAEVFLNSGMRWCLWLAEAKPSDLRALPEVMRRVRQMQRFRKQSTAAPTRKAAATTWRFFFVSQPATVYLLVPEGFSERRRFVPIGFVSRGIIASNKAYVVAFNDLFLFGLLSSSMHILG